MWNRLFEQMLDRIFRHGTLGVTMPDGAQRRFGDGGPPEIEITLTDPDLPRRIILNPELAVGEAYTDGTLTIAGDDLRGFLTLAISNLGQGNNIWWQRAAADVRLWLRRFDQWNPIGRARANVAHHYDLSGELYDLFLDADKQYSCAYFKHPDDTLEQAQEQKKAHIAGKLLLEPGMKVLDIGCGWGGMALTLARDHGAEVLGVTLSQEQHKVATERALEAGLADKVRFRLMDYRLVEETFDRIVSVGMFEHVGVPHYREYFRHVHDLLSPDGVALIHTIGRSTPPGTTSPWIAKYIFPGGYVPAMSEASAAIEKERLVTTDVEVWRLHYAETLRHWYDRFTANIDRAREIYDERFCRMWRYYLVASELTFRLNTQVVFQFQLARRQEAVPLTRDYLYPANRQDGMRHAAE
ncbi:MAG: class I SAM-dependent methyltransferase [Rhodobacteraceae bacterium]|nr:class I SAM-dependent methyltransferase [Paracoccaceae bacterium]